MKQRFILYRRSNGKFYAEDTVTRKQSSLKTRDEAEALTLLHSKNEAFRQPVLNLQIARAYLSASDAEVAKRTWQVPMNEMTMTKIGPTLERYERAMLDKAFDMIRELPILETRAEHFLKVLRSGTVATNVYLRRIHNFALDMTWLPWPILPKKQWPKVQFKEKRAITSEEHQAIIAREKNPERRAFYELCWHLGGSQSDIAHLKAEDIDWRDRTIAYRRQKSKTAALIYLGDEVLKILQTLPKRGPLFPYLIRVRSGDRATEFKQRCQGLGIEGVTLHSYRYAWAERAKSAGYPERFAMENLGHNSKAVTQAYAKKAKVLLPSLEEWQKREKIIPLPLSEHERNDAALAQAAI
jgi:integrase